jgi:hypothetical protein
VIIKDHEWLGAYKKRSETFQGFERHGDSWARYLLGKRGRIEKVSFNSSVLLEAREGKLELSLTAGWLCV